ncbi:MAG: transcriptional repressor [Oscillospiraceae bacterium]|nr:transcriptional repressor [Oscillospiraceae bacterium]
MNSLHETSAHPSAEQVYYALKSHYPRLSLGTVYRNLQRLKQEGMVRSIAVVNGQERFDGDVSEHAHFICDKCSAVIDLDIPLPDDLGASVKQDGFLLTARQLFLRGLCPECVADQRSNSY